MLVMVHGDSVLVVAGGVKGLVGEGLALGPVDLAGVRRFSARWGRSSL